MYHRREYPGGRLLILPRPLVHEALRRPPTSHLLVTDAGYFPHATRHARSRLRGSPQAIVIMCTEGSGWVEMDNSRCDVEAGQFVIIPPRVPHSYYADPDKPWSIWWLHLAGSDLPALLSAVGLTPERPTGLMADPIRLVELVASICDDLAADETQASLTAAAGAAWHLLARLAAERSNRAGNHQSIARVQTYMRENLATPLSVPALAAMAGFSTSHFSARFRDATGYTVVEYTKRLRMARARQLLITTRDPIADIAHAVGYTDPLYFSRQFTAVNHLSPTHFRTRSLEEQVH
ncbi:AraC family transcriptional regulator [Kribbella hippodromi]|uniref:AraC family transcriptional regulator n=1 Tax=Kribbella hippodromi TaxID=434347 RepID=A0ABP4P7C4_9ACTN